MGRHKKIPDDLLLAVARTVFAEEGHGASTRRIAELAGISQATLFQRFGGKDRLFVAATQPAALPVEEILGPMEEAVRLGGAGYVEAMALRLLKEIAATAPRILQMVENPSVAGGVVDEAHAQLGVPALLEGLVERVAALRNMGLLAAEIVPGAAVEALLIGIHGLVFMQMVSPGSPPPEMVLPRFVQTVFGGGAAGTDGPKTTRRGR